MIMVTLTSSVMIIAQESKETIGLTPAIQDNSFFIEEAFNQEAGVVQHIFNATYFTSPQKDYVLTFTQEWPLFSQMHQLSATVPYAFLNSNTFNGIGDILLNYRYQLSAPEQWATVAPRISVIFPVGSSSNGTGTGSAGLQINLPVSKQLSPSFIVHFNVGVTHLPNVKATDAVGKEIQRALTSYNIGSSIIWLAHTNINVLLEWVDNFTHDIDDKGNFVSATEVVVNPGLRCAIDMNSLQIVPGIGIPISMSRGDTRVGTFLYLSFEHPF